MVAATGDHLLALHDQRAGVIVFLGHGRAPSMAAMNKGLMQAQARPGRSWRASPPLMASIPAATARQAGKPPHW